MNKYLAHALSMYCNSKQTDWDLFIPSILFGYRTSIHSSTGETPYYLLYVRTARIPCDCALPPPTNLTGSIAEHRKRIVSNIERAHEITLANNQTMKTRHNQHAVEPTFEPGAKVWVFTPKPAKGLSKKLRHFWHGLFRVVEKLSPVHFVLRTCDNRRVAAAIHANRMKSYFDPRDHPIDPTEKLNDNDSDLL